MAVSREITPAPASVAQGIATFSDGIDAELGGSLGVQCVAEEVRRDDTMDLDDSSTQEIDSSPSSLASPLFLSPFRNTSPFTPASAQMSPITHSLLSYPESPSKSSNSRIESSNSQTHFDSSLSNGFLGAGTIARTVKLNVNAIFEEAEDGWSRLIDIAFDLHIHNQSNILVKKLIRLQSLSLLRSTFRVIEHANSSTPTIVFRIYLAVDSYRKRSLTAERVKEFVDVLECVVCDAEEWQGVAGAGMGKGRKLLEREIRDMTDIWDEIESPVVPEGYDGYTSGISTELMPHQVGAREKMRLIEESPMHILDPESEECTASDGRKFYVNVYDGRVVSQAVLVEVGGGGILADEAGSGKTAEVLARIAEDLGSLPDVSNASIYFDGSPSPPPLVVTDVAVTFPHRRYIAEQLALGPIAHTLLEGYEYTPADLEQHELMRRIVEKSREIQTAFPSLRNLMLNHIRTSPSIPQRRPPSNLSHSPMSELNSLLPYYTIRNHPHYLDSRAGRLAGNVSQRIYLGGSLVVVPDHLTEQWEAEIQAHCSHPVSMEEFEAKASEIEEEESKIILQRTVIDKFSVVLPSPEAMARYDLVVIAASVYARSLTEKHPSLFFVHWKRLVVDEGNIFAGGSTVAVQSRELRCQNRWAITATPTTNLVSSRLANQSQSKILANSKDLANVGSILTKLLQGTTLLPEPNSFHKKIGALFTRGRTGALRDLFRATIVKTRTKDLVLDLPELISRTVFVEPLPLERMVYNALVALFVTNSITSQKEDEDYFFHAKQKPRLKELLDNFSVSAFFFGSVTFKGSLQQALVTVGDIVRDKGVEWSQHDRRDIALALEQIRLVTTGDATMRYLDSVTIGIETRGMSDVLIKRFGGYEVESSQESSNSQESSSSIITVPPPPPPPPTFLPVDQLVVVRKLVVDIQKHGKWTDEETLTEEIITLHAKSLQPAQPNATRERCNKKALPKPLPVDSTFLSTTLHQTTSTKMNYILESLRNHPDDKFLIFSTISHTGLTTARLSEVFDIFDVPHLLFHPTKKLTRGAVASLFNDPASPYRALVVDPSSSVTRGIGLTGANRIFFLDALWQQDIEYQAIARAHRLGQKKDVVVEFILFENGWDHSVYKRRRELTEEELRSRKEVQKDEKLSGLLQSTQFLRGGSGVREVGATSFLFKDERNCVAPIRAPMVVAEVAGGKRRLEDGDGAGMSTKKIKKSVRFVD